MYSYAYLVSALVFLPIWLVIFILRNDFRKPMFILGLVFALFGPFTEFFGFLNNYWNPLAYLSTFQFLVQEIVYIFLVAGALFFLHPLLFRKKLGHKINLLRFAIVLFISLATFFIFTLFSAKDFYGILLGQVPVMIYVWSNRPDLAKVSIFNFMYGCLLAFCAFTILLYFYPNIVIDWWNTKNLMGIFIHGVPLEEILWLGFVGAGYGLLPQFIFD